MLPPSAFCTLNSASHSNTFPRTGYNAPYRQPLNSRPVNGAPYARPPGMAAYAGDDANEQVKMQTAKQKPLFDHLVTPSSPHLVIETNSEFYTLNSEFPPEP